jgi:hypothetical protein
MGVLLERPSDCRLGNPHEPCSRLGARPSPARLLEQRWDKSQPEHWMSEMHDRGIRGSESCPQLKDASREADHLSMIFAADLVRRPGFKGTAVATGENSPLKVGRRGAEPALTGYDPPEPRPNPQSFSSDEIF